MEPIPVKVLGYKRSQRYPILRTLQAAQRSVEKDHPGLRLEIQEVASTDEILRYTPVIAFPSLVVNGKLVCVGRFPKQDEVLDWLNAEIDGKPGEL